MTSNVSKLRTKDVKTMSKKSQRQVAGEKAASSELPVNVQNTDESVLLSRDLQRRVYPVNNEVKQVGVELLGEGISGVYCPLFGLGLHHRLSYQDDPPVAQPVRQPLGAHPQQLAEVHEVWVTELEPTSSLLAPVELFKSSKETEAETHRDG